MLINIGRLLMLCVWGFLILNLVHPFPRPLNIFVNVALSSSPRADAWYAAGAIEIHFTERWPADHRRKGTDFPFRVFELRRVWAARFLKVKK